MKEFCTLTREQASLYQAVVDDMLARIDESRRHRTSGLVLATMMKLKQVCNHPAHFLADGSSLRSLGQAVAPSRGSGRGGGGRRPLPCLHPVHRMGEMLERHLRRHFDCEVLWLHGGVPKKERDAMVEQFQGDDGPPVSCSR